MACCGLGQVGLAHPDGEVDLAAAHGGEAVAVGLRDRRRPARTDSRAWGTGRPTRPSGGRRPPRPSRRGCRSTAGPGTRAASPSIRTRYLRQHVGPVGEEGDAAEALGLALGAEHAARGIEAHQLGVGRGVDLDLGLDRRSVAGDVDDELRRRPSRCVDRLPSTLTDERLSSSPSSRSGRSCVAVALDAQRCADPRPLGAEVEVEPDFGHQPVGRAVILAADRDMGRRGRRFGRGLRRRRQWCGRQPWLGLRRE